MSQAPSRVMSLTGFSTELPLKGQKTQPQREGTLAAFQLFPILIPFYHFVKINKFSANSLGLDPATLRKPRGQKGNT